MLFVDFIRRHSFAAFKKIPEPGILENLDFFRFCETASFCNPLIRFEVAESDSELQICVWIAYLIEKSIFRKMPSIAEQLPNLALRFLGCQKRSGAEN